MSKSDTPSTSADANRVPALFSPIMSVIFTFIFTPPYRENSCRIERNRSYM